MKNTFSLQIPKPCAADWDQMAATAQGRFCAACQTTILDFTKMDDTAIKNFFQNYPGKVCGRFGAHQLKEYTLPVQRKPFFTFLSVLGLTAFIAPVAGLSKSPAMVTPANVITVIQEPIAKQPQSEGAENRYTVTGKITDGKDNQPLPGVSIIIKGTNLGTISQPNGRFTLQIDQPVGKVTLVFSFIGYTTIEKIIDFKNTSAIDVAAINLTLDAAMLGEVVYVGQVKSGWYKPQNIWWRVKGLWQR